MPVDMLVTAESCATCQLDLCNSAPKVDPLDCSQNSKLALFIGVRNPSRITHLTAIASGRVRAIARRPGPDANHSTTRSGASTVLQPRNMLPSSFAIVTLVRALHRPSDRQIPAVADRHKPEGKTNNSSPDSGRDDGPILPVTDDNQCRTGQGGQRV